MRPHRYHALSADGRHVRGVLNARDVDELETVLRPLGLILIRAHPRRGFFPPRRAPGRAEMIQFCFQLEQLLEAGLPLFDSLAALRDAAAGSATAQLAGTLLADVECGKPFSVAAARHSPAFSPVTLSLLRAGEQVGTLANALHEVGALFASEEAFASQARQIAIYPAIVVSVLLLAVITALTQLVPELEKLLRSSGSSLPLQTRVLLALSHFVRDSGALVAALGAAAWGALGLALRRSESLRTDAHALVLKLPLVGDILAKLALARIAALLATLYAAGINLVEALRACEDVSGNLFLRDGLRHAGRSIAAGQSLSTSCAEAGVFPPLLLRMLRTGEHTGALDHTLHKVASLYRREVGSAIARLQATIEPTLTIVMGGLLLWIASAVLGPIYDVITRMPV